MDSIQIKADKTAPRTGSVTTTSGGPLLSPSGLRTDIPLPFAIYNLYGQRHKLSSTYMAMRTPSGVCSMTQEEIAEKSGVSVRTVRNHIDRLLEDGFLRPHAKKGVYYVVGIRKVCQNHLGCKAGKVWVETRNAGKNLKKVLILAVIGWLNRQRQYINSLRPSKRKGRLLEFDGLAATVISKRTGMSRTWVFKWIGKLVRERMLRRQHQRRKVETMTEGQVRQMKSNASWLNDEDFAFVKRLRVAAGQVHEMLPSVLTPLYEAKTVRRIYG